MSFTQNDVATAAMTELGEDTSNASLVLQFEEWVQDIYDKVGILTNWRFSRFSDTITTVASTRTYVLDTTPGNEDDILGIWIPAQNKFLPMRPKRELLRKGIAILEEGTPQYWYWEEEWDGATDALKIGLYLVPDAVYTLNVIARGGPKDLTSGADVPMPDSFRHVLKAGVLMKAHLNESRLEEYREQKQDFLDGVALIIRRHKFSEEEPTRLEIVDVPETAGMPPVQLPANFPGY
jgi:hypothetical protein